MVAMTTATITRRLPVHPRLRFGIGATPIRAITLRYPNARFRGDRLFSKRAAKPLPTSLRRKAVIQLSDLTRWAPATGGCLYEEKRRLRQRARSYETPLSSRPTGGPPRSPASSSGAPRSRTAVRVPCSRTSASLVTRDLKARRHHRQQVLRATGCGVGSQIAAIDPVPPFAVSISELFIMRTLYGKELLSYNI